MFDFIKDNPITFFVILIAICAPSLFFGALQVFGYIILGIIILVLILGLVFRAKIRRLQRDVENQMNGGQPNGGGFNGGFYNFNTRQRSSQRPTSAEGDVKIFTTDKSTEKRVSNQVGDYVDFEEIKEE